MENHLIKILLIEDDLGNADLIKRMLSQEQNPSFDVECAGRLETAFERFSKGGVDLVLLDLYLPDSSGPDTVAKFHARIPSVPIVTLTRQKDGAIALQAIQRGAQDYLFKDKIDSQLLVRTIRYAIERKRAQEELLKAHQETELILSSITSILIGLNPNDQITHWNAVAETIFGVKRESVIHQPLHACGVQWDSAAVIEGVKECRRKGQPTRVNDVRFLRLGQQEGFLGITIIPVKGDSQDRLNLLIFGADITERKKLEQLKDGFVSTVSHELRTPLTVIREGVSQVLDGILGETTEAQRKFLSISLQAIDRLSRIINDLLDISKIEAEKLELKLDLVDIVRIVQDIVADTSPFQLRAKSKGLTLKASLSQGKIEIYTDRDKLIQVFTNLVGNALKFTEQGFVEISILDGPRTVECSIRDTGKGIAEEDVHKVFTKFQQFGRTHGPGEKGTGLGLAISKGLVEMHGGKIWMESELGKGTAFIFALPKLTAREIFKGHISKALRKAIERETSVSIALFEVKDFSDLEKKIGQEKTASLMESLERSIKQSLRHKADIVVRSKTGVLVILPSTNEEDVLSAVERMERDYQKGLSQVSTSEAIEIVKKVVSFPDDGQTEEEIITKLTK